MLELSGSREHQDGQDHNDKLTVPSISRHETLKKRRQNNNETELRLILPSKQLLSTYHSPLWEDI